MSARVRRTLGNMLEHGHTAWGECRTCGAHRPIDFVRLIAKVGPDYSLWNRRCRCRLTDGCRGWIKFYCGPGWPHIMCDEATASRWMDLEMEERRR